MSWTFGAEGGGGGAATDRISWSCSHHRHLHPDACIVSCVFFSIGFLPYGTSDKRTESLDDYLAGECTIHKISSYIRYLPVYLDTHVGTGTD